MARHRPSRERDWRDAATATALLSIRFPDHRTPETPGVRRKLRLVLCGAARTVWDRLPHDDLRAAVAVAERFADGLASKKELDKARQEVVRHRTDYGVPDNVAAEYALCVIDFVETACERSVTVVRTADETLPITPVLATPLDGWAVALEAGRRGDFGPDPAAAVVRDLFGGPTTPRFADGWRTEAVTAIARGVAADAAFDRLPILADALEDAGCADERVLAHCRGPGPHWRGCWVVDGVLGL